MNAHFIMGFKGDIQLSAHVGYLVIRQLNTEFSLNFVPDFGDSCFTHAALLLLSFSFRAQAGLILA